MVLDTQFFLSFHILMQLCRMCVIDPIHNLLLGTAMVELWKVLAVISPKEYDDIHSYVCPSDMG